MENKITGKEYSLSKIFSKEFDYHIPSYQRPYSWEEEQTETLFVNLYDFFQEKHQDASVLFEIEAKPNANKDNPLTSVELTDEEKTKFISVLDGEVYNLTSKRRNYMILRLDSFLSDGGASYNPKILTIEHVLPQTVVDSSYWSQKWEKEDDRKFWLHRIANLVPLTRRKNSEAQNYDFDIKKSKYFYSTKGISCKDTKEKQNYQIFLNTNHNQSPIWFSTPNYYTTCNKIVQLFYSGVRLLRFIRKLKSMANYFVIFF